VHFADALANSGPKSAPCWGSEALRGESLGRPPVDSAGVLV